MPSSTSTTEGAASAAPSIAVREDASLAEIDRMEQAAADAISDVQDPDAAEQLLHQVTVAEHAVRLAKVSEEREQRWGRLRLLSERRYGELLPPKQPGKKAVTGGDRSARMTASRARKVADVPKDDFDDYVNTTARPTRSGLLRRFASKVQATKPKPKPKKEALPPLEEAVGRLRGKVRHLRTLSRRQMPKWSRPDMADVEAVLKGAKKRRPKYAGKRLRENSALRKNLNRKSVADLQFRILQMTQTLETSEIADYDLAKEDAFLVNELYDDLVQLQLWMDHTLDVTRAHMDEAHQRKVIRHLRENHAGMPQPEIENALRRADLLEAKLNRKLDAAR